MESQTAKKNNKVLSFLIQNKVKLFFGFKIFIAIGLLWFLISYVEWSDILLAVTNAKIEYLIFAFLLSSLNIYLQFYKWRLTTNYILKENSSKKILLSLFHGFSAAVFTPARIGEYFGRAIALKDKPVYKVALATLLDKLFPLILVAFFGSIGTIIFIHIEYELNIYLTSSIFIILIVLFILFFKLLWSENFWENILLSKLKSSSRLKKYLEKVKEIKTLDKVYASKMLFVSFLFYSCFLIQYALLVSAFSSEIRFIEYLWVGNLIMFAKTIIPPISFGELGIREGASIYFISKVGESSTVGFNASIFLFLINVLLPAIIGFVLLFRKADD